MPSSNKSSSNQGGYRSSNQGKSAGGGSSSSGNTNYGMIKDGWGNRPNFQASYGLPMSPEGIEQGNQILDAFREADRQSGNRK